MNCGLSRAGGAAAIAFGLMAALNGASAQPMTSVARAGGSDAYPAYRLGLLQRATDLLGAEVRDRDNHKLGKIADLVVDCSSWRVVCALVRPANFYGEPDYFIAVPAGCFRFTDTNRVVLGETMTNFLGLPPFKSDGWDAAAIYKSLTNAYTLFNQPLPWNEQTGLGRLAHCSDLLDMDVDDGVVNIGQVADLMIDLPGERVMFGLIAFYGLDENLHAAPPGALKLGTNASDFQLHLDPGMVGALVNREEFLRLDLGDPAWAAAIYRDYGQKLVFDPSAAGLVTEARKQVRDYVPPPPPTIAAPEDPNAVLTRVVWRAILETDIENGFLAREMKVLAADGKVTLTGKVGTDKDRSNFETIAEGVAGAGNVKNELEVK